MYYYANEDWQKLSIMSVHRNVNLWLLHISRGRVEHFILSISYQENAIFNFVSTWKLVNGALEVIEPRELVNGALEVIEPI